MSLVWPDRFAPTRDHVMPYSLGGGNEPENLALAHFTCNVSKKNRVTAATPA
jgi:5-methylcytosine-specific restriction endonuclease McrA